MLDKISILVMGIIFIALGVYFFFYRTSYDWDLGSRDTGQYHWVIGIIFVIGGIYFVYNGTKAIIRDKRKRRNQEGRQ